MFGLADIARLAETKPRTVQLWTDRGVLKAIGDDGPGGKGNHRKYEREEAIIASWLAPLSHRQVGIGELLRVSQAIRAFLETPANAIAVDQAIANRGASSGGLAIATRQRGDASVFLITEQEPSLNQVLQTLGKGRCAFLISHSATFQNFQFWDEQSSTQDARARASPRARKRSTPSRRR